MNGTRNATTTSSSNRPTSHASDLWEALVWLDWRFGETTSLALGYRALDIDHRKGNAQADITLHGPLLGVIFRF